MKSKVKTKVIAETPRKTHRIPIPASNHSKHSAHSAQRNETEGSSETSGMQGGQRWGKCEPPQSKQAQIRDLKDVWETNEQVHRYWEMQKDNSVKGNGNYDNF